MRTALVIVPIVLVAATGCEPEEPTSADGAPTGGVPGAGSADPDALNEVLWTDPADGAQDHYVRDPILVGLRLPEESVAFEVRTEDGDPVTGEVASPDGGLTWGFWEDGPLFADTGYRVAVLFPSGAYAFEFRTSPLGEPLDDGVDGVGTYELPWDQVDVSSPASFEDLVGDRGRESLLLRVESGGSPGFRDLLVARSAADQTVLQDLCSPTAWWEGASFLDAPFLGYSAVEGRLPSAAGLLTLAHLSFETTYASDGASLEQVRLEGVLDLRDVEDLDVAQACELEASLGGACIPCADGAAACVQVAASGGTAVWTDQGIVERDAQDVATDPGCSPSAAG